MHEFSNFQTLISDEAIVYLKDLIPNQNISMNWYFLKVALKWDVFLLRIFNGAILIKKHSQLTDMNCFCLSHALT